MKKLLVIITALCLLCACLLLGGCGGRATTIDLNKYVVWDDSDSGKYDGQGSLQMSFDMDAFKKDYAGKLELTTNGMALATEYSGMSVAEMLFETCVDYDCDFTKKSSRKCVCNGDEMTVNWKANEELALDYFNCKLKYTDETKTVEGLEEKAVKFSGENCILMGKEGNMEWDVLEQDGDKLLVITQYILDERQYYNDKKEKVTWETCSLRAWLNNEFINETFTEKEKHLILTTKVKNADNPEFGTDGGNDTEDKLFLLSIDEQERYHAARPLQEGEEDDCRQTWLRSPGEDLYHAAVVEISDSYSRYNGVTNKSGEFVDGSYKPLAYRVEEVDEEGFAHKALGLRPAMWINIAK